MIDLTQKLLDKYPPKPKKVGRYSCSDIYPILKGWLTPEDFIKGKEVDFKGAMNMWNGTAKHKMTQELLKDDYTMELKKEMKVKDFVIVGMADCLNDEEILEIKTSFLLHDKAKPWAAYQIKLYLTLFERPAGRLVQPVRTGNKLYLKVLGEYKRNDAWFNKQMEKLNEFHEKMAEEDAVLSQVEGELKHDADHDIDEKKVNRLIEEELADSQPERQAENQAIEKNK